MSDSILPFDYKSILIELTDMLECSMKGEVIGLIVANQLIVESRKAADAIPASISLDRALQAHVTPSPVCSHQHITKENDRG